VQVAFADIGDVRLFYTDEGSGGPPLLFVHGYACDSHDWSWQLPHFGAKHRVIAVDLRGHGRSSAPEAGYCAARLAADLAGLLKGLEVEGVIVLGHSLGGLIASVLAVEYPSLVAGLVCVDPGYLLPDETASAVEPLLDALHSGDPVPVIQQIFQGLDSPARSPATGPALRTWRLRRAAGVPAHVLRQAFESQVRGLVLNSNSRPFLRRRDCPVLAFHADPERAAMETELFGDERSRAIGWEGAGHWLHQERPAEFNTIVSAWLASTQH
jgi:pimeloyl-ACP methyl ester carboxylesterase